MEKKLKPGEKGLSIILILFSIFTLIESYKISGNKLTASSSGAFPMFISVMLFIFSIWIYFEKTNVSDKEISITERMKETRDLILTKDISVFIIMLIIYAILLEWIGFETSTLLFLWAGISFLYKNNIIKNLGISILTVGIIVIIFNTIFKVILP